MALNKKFVLILSLLTLISFNAPIVNAASSKATFSEQEFLGSFSGKSRKVILEKLGNPPIFGTQLIREILKKDGPLSKEQVLEKVMKERYVKANTVMVNLQNPKYFKKLSDGTYTVA